jgi:ribosomal-protein-alanine N-acetyltransferase
MQLRGEKIALRLLESEADIQKTREALANRSVMGDFNPVELIKKQVLEEKSEITHLVIYLPSQPDTILGGISCSNAENKDIFEVGFWIYPEHQRKGYCTEAVQIILDYLFLNWNIHRIQCLTHPKNIPSQKLLEKIGFVKEGVLRKYFFMNGEWVDLIMYSRLREEWDKPKYLN